MKKQVFVGILNAIKEQKEREETFCKAISAAYTDAGECEDFRDCYSYEPPTNVFIDKILDTLAQEFVSEHQTLESAEDTIHWWAYEAEMGKMILMEEVSGEDGFGHQNPIPLYIEIDGRRMVCDTAEGLYDILVYCRDHHYTPEETDVREDLKTALDNTTPEDPLKGYDMDFRNIFAEVEDILEHQVIPTDNIKPTTRLVEDLGCDSMDMYCLATEVLDRYRLDIFNGEAPTTVEDLVRAIMASKSK